VTGEGSASSHREEHMHKGPKQEAAAKSSMCFHFNQAPLLPSVLFDLVLFPQQRAFVSRNLGCAIY